MVKALKCEQASTADSQVRRSRSREENEQGKHTGKVREMSERDR
jgi:hypothetical protein